MKISHVLLGLAVAGFCLGGSAFAAKHHAGFKHRHHHAVHRSVSLQKVDINQANEKQLASLKGLGRKKAKAIVAYRQQNGGFGALSDLAKVHGLSQATVARIVKLNPGRLLLESRI